jgi:hypothetical protein
MAQRGGAAEIGAQKRADIFLRWIFFGAQLKNDFVADETQKAFAGRGCHGWNRLLHAGIFTMKTRRHKAKAALGKRRAPRWIFISLWVALARWTI